jgi:putative ABC transport system permease protein
MLIENERGERNGIIVTRDIAEKLNIEIGDQITARVRTVFRQQNVGEFVVRAISFDPQLFGRLSAFADLSYINELVQLEPGEYQILGIFIEDIQAADELSADYYEALKKRVSVFERHSEDRGGNPVLALFDQADEQDWEGVRYALYTINDVLNEVDQIINLLNGAALVILVVLFIIIMVGITNTFRRIMYERIREIGTMRALGMQRPRVQQLFLLEALFMSLGGVVIGLGLAGLAMVIVGSIDIGIDSTISILLKNGRFTFRVLPRQVAINASIVALLTLAAAFVPTWTAARLSPANALRAE